MVECQGKVRGILTEHRPVLEALAAALIEKEVLQGDEIERIVNGPSSPGQPLPGPEPSSSPRLAGEGGPAPALAPSPSPA
jgi:hypothetical protein